MTRFLMLAGGIYLLLVALIIGGLFQARKSTLAATNPDQRQQEWENWREEVRRQKDADLPVRRRVPDSSEPPATVLLRDNFGTVLTGAVILTSLVYWASAFLIHGAIYGPKFPMEGSKNRRS